MREIEFRAWYSHEDSDEKEMLFVGDSHGTRDPLDCCKYFLDGQPVTLMQFTGLLDKNGVKIFEGDLITNERGRTGQVVWHEPSAGFDTNFVSDDSTRTDIDLSWGFSTLLWPSHVEVVGNIYSNPELLESGQ